VVALVALGFGLTSLGIAIWRIVDVLDGPEALADRIVWSTPGEPLFERDLRAWMTDELLISTDLETGKVVAQAKADGSVRWTYQVPGAKDPRGEVCAVSGSTLNGAVALAYRPAGDGCGGLMLLDLGTGRPRWNVTLAKEGLEFTAVDVAGDLVVGVFRGASSFQTFAGYDAGSGAQRWQRDSGCEGTGNDNLVGSPSRIAFVGSCRNERSDVDEIRSLDPATGRELSRFQLEGREANLKVVSAEPLVVYDPDAGRMLVLSQDGRRISTEFAAKHSVIDPDRSSVVGDSFVMVAEDRGWSAWDLRTGKLRWEGGGSDVDVDGVIMYADERVVTGEHDLVLQADHIDEVALLRLDPRTGTASAISPALESDLDLSGRWFLDGQQVYVVGGPGQAVAFTIG
jgi:outer membrane protein assembly factor BamB